MMKSFLSRVPHQTPRGVTTASSTLFRFSRAKINMMSSATRKLALTQPIPAAVMMTARKQNWFSALAGVAGLGLGTLMLSSTVAHADEKKSDVKTIPVVTNKPRTIIIAFDSSVYSEYAFQWSLENILREGDHVVLFNARYIPTHDGHLPVSSKDREYIDTKKLARSQEIATKFLAICKQRNLDAEVVLVRGDPRMMVVDAGHRRNADMIILGSRGLGPVSRMLLGSVSSFTVQHSHCPIIVVRPQEGKESKGVLGAFRGN